MPGTVFHARAAEMNKISPALEKPGPLYARFQLLGVNIFYLLSGIKNSLGTEAEFNFFCVFPAMTIVNILFVTCKSVNCLKNFLCV